jgi:hypothetical protein
MRCADNAEYFGSDVRVCCVDMQEGEAWRSHRCVAGGMMTLTLLPYDRPRSLSTPS